MPTRADDPLAGLVERPRRRQRLGTALVAAAVVIGLGGYGVVLLNGGLPSDPCAPDIAGCGPEPALWLVPWGLAAMGVAGVVLVAGLVLRRRERFNAPPGWPAPPPSWQPPTGWQPDPGWPDPPDGRRLWRGRR